MRGDPGSSDLLKADIFRQLIDPWIGSLGQPQQQQAQDSQADLKEVDRELQDGSRGSAVETGNELLGRKVNQHQRDSAC